jgi:hypothetical protein
MGILLLLAGCTVAEEPIDEPEGEGWSFAAAPVCEEPHAGFDRLSEQAGSRGIDLPVRPPDFAEKQGQYVHPVLAHDLDADGDIDLAFGQLRGSLDLYVNDGTGHFEARADGIDVEDAVLDQVGAHGFADVDGDGLPELFRAGFGFLQVRRNLGGLEWGTPRVIHTATDGRAQYTTLGLGDSDGDGDLDVVLPSLHDEFDPEEWGLPPGAPELLFRNDSGQFVFDRELGAVQPGMSQLGFFTDRDVDGDLDLFVGADLPHDQYPPTSFYRNDGGTWVDDAAAIGAAHRAQVMGADSWDQNADGRPDYCFTVIGRTLCLLSEGDGWIDASAAFNIIPDGLSAAQHWTAWSLEITDLDHDGREDVVAAAGKPDDVGGEGAGPGGAPWLSDQPNGLFAGTDDGFEDRAAAVSFGSLEHAYGMAAADFDGDGWQDVAIGYSEQPMELWMNRCGPGAWLDVELVGAADNTEGYGASVEVTADGLIRRRELHALRTAGQGPSRLHFGLGDTDRADSVAVVWTDGARSEVVDAPTRGVLTVRHPEAE